MFLSQYFVNYVRAIFLFGLYLIQIVFTEYLTRKIQEGRNNEKFLKRTIEEKQRSLEEAQRKIKDLQIRLIR